jgi:DHA1 family tetracycline resistance protein-like MFS transporter
LPGYAAAGLSLAAASFGAWKLPEPPRIKHASSPIFSLDDVRGAARSARLSTPLTLAFLGVLAFSAFESMFVLFGLALFPTYFGLQQAIEHATRDETIAAARYSGRYLFVVGLISAAIQGGLIRRLVPRFGETRLAVVGPLILGLGLAIVGLAPSFAWVVLGCVVMPLGFGLNNPSVGSLISRSAPAHQQGAVLGLQQSLQSLARLTGPWIAGLCFTALGPRSPFFGATLVLVLAALLAWRYHRRFGAGFAPARAPSA